MQHISIAFTMEIEENDLLSFLDVKINGENNNFITSVDQKSILSQYRVQSIFGYTGTFIFCVLEQNLWAPTMVVDNVRKIFRI